MLKNGLDVKKLTKQVGYTTWRALTERPEGFEKVNLQLSFLLEKVTVQLAKTTSYYQKNEKRLVSVRLSQTKKQDLKGGNRQLELASYRGRLTWGIEFRRQMKWPNTKTLNLRVPRGPRKAAT